MRKAKLKLFLLCPIAPTVYLLRQPNCSVQLIQWTAHKHTPGISALIANS